MDVTSKLLPDSILKKYSRRLLVLLSIVVLVIATIGGIAYLQTGDALQRNAETNLEQATELQAHAVEEWVQGTENHLNTLSTAAEVESNDSTAVEQRLRTEQESMSDSVVALHHTDSEFEVLASSVDGAETELDTDEIEWARDGIAPGENETVRVGPYPDPLADGQQLAIVTGTSGGDGYLVAVIDLESQTDAFEDRLTRDDAFSVVLDREATVLMSHHSDRIGESDEGHEGEHLEIVERALEGESGYVRMDMSDHGRDSHDDHDDHEGGVTGHHGDLAMGYAPIDGTDWALMIHVPADDAFALQEQIGQLLLALLAVSLIGLGTVGLVVGRNTSRSLTELAAKARELERGDLDTELESSRADELGQLYDAFGNMRDSLRESLHEAEAAKRDAERQRRQLEAVARQLEDEAEEIMARAADGDLTGRIDVSDDSEELKRVAAEYNEMVDEIERTVGQLKQFASTVAEHSEEVTASAEELQQSSETVSRSVQRISAQTSKQDDKLQRVSAHVTEVSTTTEEIAALSQDVSTIADRTARAGEQGRDAAQRALASMDAVDRESRETVAAIEAFESEIAQVEDIAGLIAEVANQMNMLALNANIEASRSEETDSEGFGAVAEEVKALSEQSKASAERIEEITEDIRSETTAVVEEVRETREEITTAQERVERAADAYDDVVDAADKASDGVSRISSATEEQAASTQEIVAMVDETAELSSAVANEASDVAAAAEEQTSALSEVTTSAERLTSEATDLEEGLDRFDVSTDSAATGSNDGSGESSPPVVDTDGSGSTDGDPIDGEDQSNAGDPATEEGRFRFDT